jgi:hypothetical protein
VEHDSFFLKIELKELLLRPPESQS